MGIPPGVPVKAAKSIGPCPSYCRADCPGTQRPAHPPGACPGVPAAWLPAAALRLIRKGTLYVRRTCSGRRMTQGGHGPALLPMEANGRCGGRFEPLARARGRSIVSTDREWLHGVESGHPVVQKEATRTAQTTF